MKKIIWLFLTSCALAQSPVTVTGTIVDATNNPATSGYVQFDIQPQPSNVQFNIPGSTAIVLSTAQCGINASGQLKNLALSGPCTVWGNDLISPANTCYTVTFAPNGGQTQSVPNEQITGSVYDLSSPKFCTIVNLVPQYTSITTAPVNANIVPAVKDNFFVGLPQWHYAGGYFNNLFLGANAFNASTLGGSGDCSPNFVQKINALGAPTCASANSSRIARGWVNIVTDCGAVGYPTNDGPAIQACFDLYPGYGFLFPQLTTHGCSYRSSQTLFPKGSGYQIIGESGSNYLDGVAGVGHLGGVEICFDAGVSGFWHDGNNAESGSYRNIAVKGGANISSLIAPTGINMPSDLPQYTRSLSSIQRTGNELTVTIVAANSTEGLTQQVGSTVEISGVVGDTTMNGLCTIDSLSAGGGSATNPRTFTCPQNGSNSGPFASDGTLSLPTTGTDNSDGFRICGNFVYLEHVGAVAWGRHGINADSRNGHGCAVPFSDDLVIIGSIAVENNGDGFNCTGVDCNAGWMAGNAYYYNMLYGQEDNSSLGNTHIGEQISNNGHLWATASTPATKTISTVSRTLTGGHSNVTVVLSQADTNLKQGSCVVISGVSDSSFNTPAGQCYFITVFTDSTHFQYEQPGAVANASSSGGTSRMAKFGEVYLSAGVDDGATKFATQSSVWSSAVFSNYIEGGQGCKYGASVLVLSGASTPGCQPAGQDWNGVFITTNGISGGPATNITGFVNNIDGNMTMRYKAGKTADFQEIHQYQDHNGVASWTHTIAVDNGSTISYQLTDRSGNRKFYIDPSLFRISAGSGSAVEINKDSNSGTGGLTVCTGGASPTCPASSSISSANVHNASGLNIISGNLAFTLGKGQHFTYQAAANDVAGTFTVSASTTGSVTFTTNYTSTPVCILTPQTTGLTSWFLSAISNSGFTVTVAPSGTYTFGYRCDGNPN